MGCNDFLITIKCDDVHATTYWNDIQDKPDVATKDEIVKEFKTINGQEITGTGNIEISSNVDTSNFATKDEVNTLSNNITNNYALKNEIPSLEGYAKMSDIPDTSNLATKGEIVKDFKTINGQEITGTGNIEISTDVDTSNFATKDEVNTLSNNITNNYALKNEIPSLDGYAKTTDIPDISNLATKGEIVKEFKTINGQEITGTGNIEISSNVDTSKFARTDISNTFNGDNVFEPTNIDAMCATFNGRTLFKNEINIEIDTISKEDISMGTQCDMKQTQGQVATLYTGRILAPKNNTTSHSRNVIKFGNYNNLKFVDGDGLYINNEKLTDTYARKDEIPDVSIYNPTNNFKTINGKSIIGTGDVNIVWTGTQEQYDALSDKSAYLFYLIH